MTSKTRKIVYCGLGALNAILFMLASQSAFAAAPKVAYAVALASAGLATFMREWHASDATVLPALEATVTSIADAKRAK